MPFRQLAQYCMSSTEVENAVHKLIASPSRVRYKFGIQVLKEIKNTIDLDKKNEKVN